MKRKWIFVAVGVVLVAVFAFAAMKHQEGKVTQVELSKVTRDDVIAHVKAPGKIEPFTLVKMSATLPGKVTSLVVQEGERVHRGQLLLQLDPTQYEADLRRARAALSAAESQMQQAKFNMDRADQMLVRNKALMQKGLISPNDMEVVQNASDVAHSGYQAALDGVAQARALMASSQDNLDKISFRAPFDGVVSALNVEAGENVITGTMNNPGTQILTVADTTRMVVRAEVDETDIVNVTLGQTAQIKVDAFPDSVFRGSVVEVGNTAKGASGGVATTNEQSNYEVKVVFLDHIPGIRPGMTADVEIKTRESRNVLAVPIQAVVVRTQKDLDDARRQQSGKKGRDVADAAENITEAQKKARDKEVNGVFVVNKGVARFVAVVPGVSSDLNTEVLGGLKAGDEIVSGPYQELRTLKDGARVKKAVVKNKGEKKS